jgi:DNA excision repair protein ERCC-4
VYTGKISEHGSAVSNGGDTLHPVLEELPKWNVLVDILEEIERDVYFNPTTADGSSGAILIMCSSTATCSQLRELLQTMHTQTDLVDSDADGEAQQDAKTPGSTLLRRRLRNYIKWKLEFAKVSDALFQENQKSINGQTEQKGFQLNKGRAPPNKRRRVRGSSAVASGPTRSDSANIRTAGDRDAHIQSLMAELQISAAEAGQKEEVSLDPLENMEDYYEIFEMKDLMIVYPYDGDMDDHVLEEVKPRYVIMYEPDAAFIRRVEIYRSSHVDRGIRVYFLYYGGSVEEQRYLSSVRREKDAFTKLIKERGSMAITLDNANVDPEEAFLRTINTRIAGGGRLTATSAPPRVVVDTREFRSSLPSLLHGRSMEIVPVLLTVGDYVLTPNIVIERKSVSDLISSLNSGRLFNQCEVMMRHYKSPMLLIEFDQNKSFILEPFADLSTSASSKAASQLPDLHSKLVMLTLAFPRLRIIWSSSPYQTAAIFEELKKQQEEPDPINAVQTGLEEGEDADTARAFHQTPIEMLREIPGITEKNITKITLEVESIHELANMDEDEVVARFGREAGRPIYRFFNKDHMAD